MADNSHQQHSDGRRAGEPLTLDEISKFFSMPIADAASNLGVGTSALKRMCRDNGLVRWPYRKIISGKTIEEINKEVAATMSPAAVDMTFGAQLQDGFPSSDAALKLQRGALVPDRLLQQQGNRFFQSGRQNVFPSSQAKTVPTYLDEFKQGFPSDGLSSISTRWWGSISPDDAEKTSGEEPTSVGTKEQESRESPNDMEVIGEKPEKGSDKDVIGSQGADLLSSVRKRAAEDGKEVVKLLVARGYGPHKLRKKERMVLSQVFQSSYPSLWR